jgi:hypothetical protein
MICQSVFRLGIVSILLVFLSAVSLPAQQENKTRENNIQFLWSFGAIRHNPTGSEFKSIFRDTILKTGDQIKFFIKLKNRCHVYLLYFSSKDELNVLFPHKFHAAPPTFFGPDSYFIPEGNMWFELDSHVGVEMFYLLASAERLENLEILTNQYKNADPIARAELSDRIRTEIKFLKKKNMRLKASAERPVRIIGGKRAAGEVKNTTNEDLALHAMEITGIDFYYRSYTIEHQ